MFFHIWTLRATLKLKKVSCKQQPVFTSTIDKNWWKKYFFWWQIHRTEKYAIMKTRNKKMIKKGWVFKNNCTGEKPDNGNRENQLSMNLEKWNLNLMNMWNILLFSFMKTWSEIALYKYNPMLHKELMGVWHYKIL